MPSKCGNGERPGSFSSDNYSPERRPGHQPNLPTDRTRNDRLSIERVKGQGKTLETLKMSNRSGQPDRLRPSLALAGECDLCDGGCLAEALPAAVGHLADVFDRSCNGKALA